MLDVTWTWAIETWKRAKETKSDKFSLKLEGNFLTLHGFEFFLKNNNLVV